MKWYENWIQVFKIGEHTDSAGNSRVWTQEDLDTIVANYDPTEQEAPVVLGHPKTDEPAYAWVSGLRTESGILYAKLDKVDPEFSLWVEKGLYRKISIALDADLNLRHVGFLGAANPAVKGLCNDFAAEEEDNFLQYCSAGILFSKSIQYPEGTLPSKLRCAQQEEELKDSPTSRSHVSKLISLGCGTRGEPLEQSSPSGFFDKKPSSLNFTKKREFTYQMARGSFGTSENNMKGFNMFKKQSTQEFATRVDELERELEFAQKAQARQEFGAFLGTLHSQAKITAEDKIHLAQVFETLSELDANCFSKEAEGTSVSAFTDFLAALPPRVELKELATRENSPKGTYRTPQEELGMKIAGSIRG